MISGKNLVAGKWENNSKAEQFQTVNPKTEEPLSTFFQQATSDQINESVKKASESFDLFAETSLKDRAFFLKCIQEEMLLAKSQILELYQQESALPEGLSLIHI